MLNEMKFQRSGFSKLRRLQLGRDTGTRLIYRSAMIHKFCFFVQVLNDPVTARLSYNGGPD